MSALEWLDGTLNGTAFEAFGQGVKWSDMVGNVMGLTALALGWRRSIWTWPAQFLAGLILVAAYASAQLSGGVGKQLLVIGVAVWGWRQWQRGASATAADDGSAAAGRPSGDGAGDGAGNSADGRITVRFATWRERGLLLAGTAAGTLAVGGLFTLYPQLSWSPWADAYIFVGTLAAMVAQARGWVEFWFAWLLVDLVGVPLAFGSGLAFSGLVYVIYFVLVLWGLRDWWLRSRAKAANDPALEGAPA
ncbi:nicotinamide mononucleotide transporter family protein [Streptomyces radiopugnans]|uniref:Nicotinamide mononucleotide transporter n=1 Tax=Streptomyces radiopugnans TaxID=403935 RepID=A0A1H9BNI7_9ACTN|nr:nicotinamide mononucleotide transporter family protein [Streptomyces radiopugnans]SEP90512.1 nicotinamide mononucleotide transporter [Streptomyces radiopugnans]